jgi:hypothetical protein
MRLIKLKSVYIAIRILYLRIMMRSHVVIILVS